MSFIIGKKIGMTQIFDENGNVVPVTVLEAGPMVVVQKKTVGIDGYSALKLGFIPAKARLVNKPDKGQFEKIGKTPMKYLKEYKTDSTERYELGDTITVTDMFREGDFVDVCGVSKGKGFQGNIKRWGYSRGKETHGSHFHRRPGSLSANSDPSRVFKGKKLPGHMGVDRITVQNLTVAKVDSDKNILLIKGAVPGPKGGICTVTAARKKNSI